MTEEERRLARRENAWFLRFLRAFALSSVYGALGFFALWTIKDAVPALAAAFLPMIPQSNPYRLISYLTISVAGVAWFASYIALWLILDRTSGARNAFRKLAVWCAVAALIWLAGEFLILLALRSV